MSLWNNIDAANSAPKFLLDSANFPSANSSLDFGGLSRNVDIDNAYFVDVVEAGVTANRANGIKTPGWNLFKTYGDGRKYVETLVAMKAYANTAGDLGISGNTTIEDSTIADS